MTDWAPRLCVAAAAGIIASCGGSGSIPGPYCEPAAEAPAYSDRLVWERAYEGVDETWFSSPIGLAAGGVVVSSRGVSGANAFEAFDDSGDPLWSVSFPDGASDVTVGGNEDVGLAAVGRRQGRRWLWQYDFAGQLTNELDLGPLWRGAGDGDGPCDRGYYPSSVLVAPRGEVSVITYVANDVQEEPVDADCVSGGFDRFEMVVGPMTLKRDADDSLFGGYDRLGQLVLRGWSPDMVTKFTLDYEIGWEKPEPGGSMTPMWDGGLVFRNSTGTGSKAVREIYAWDEVGNEVWRVDSETCGSLGWAAAGPAGSVYIGSNTEERSWIRKHDNTGSLEWIHEFEPGVETSSAAIDGLGHLYVVGHLDEDPRRGWIARLDP